MTSRHGHADAPSVPAHRRSRGRSARARASAGGRAPSRRQEGYAIDRRKLVADVQRAFERISDDRGIVEQSSATVLFLSREELRANGVTAERIASFLSRYRPAATSPRRPVRAHVARRKKSGLSTPSSPATASQSRCTGALRSD